MIDLVTEAFASDLTRRALLGGLLAALTGALVGTWVVVRGLSFLGDALAHGVLPGIALAVLWGVDVTVGALASAVVMVVAVSVVDRATTLSQDTAIGLLFIGMLALGVVLLSRRGTDAGDLTELLFGDLSGVGTGQLALQGVALVATALAVLVGYRPFLALAFNADKAEALGMRPHLASAALLALLALAIVTSFRAVGTLLVFGLLIAPPATAIVLVRRVPTAMALAAALGCTAVVVGLTVSYHAGTAGSATVAGVAVGQFFLALAGREAAARLRRAAR